MYLASDDDPASAEYVTMPRAEIRRRLEPHIGEVMSAEARRALRASLADVPHFPDPKRGRFDHFFVRRRKRAPATTRTAIPATKTQLPHHMSLLTRPTTMRIAETTAIRVKNG
jgi:hypothetical protein